MNSWAKWFRNSIFFGVLLVMIASAGFHYTFRRPPQIQLSTRQASGNTFLVLGDSRFGDDVYQTIVATIVALQSSAAFLIHTGDMISIPGNLIQWKHFLNMTAPIMTVMPWYGVVGNHDVRSWISQKIYQWGMDLPGNKLYYSFDTLQSHFIVLDTEIPGEAGTIRGEQFAWLKQDLTSHASTAQRIFVFTHQPPFPQGAYRGKGLTNADELHQLFCQYHVKLVFSGHEHQYYTFRKDAITYVVTGGAGAPLMNGGIGKGVYNYLSVELVSADAIRLQFLDIHGKALQTELIH
jgi:acid phosphatase type 7